MSETTALVNENMRNQPGVDRRRHDRWKVFEIALLNGNGGSAACVVDNFSDSGALVSSDIAVSPGDLATLEIDEIEAIPAKVIRVQGSLIALAFEFEPGQAERFHDWLLGIEKEIRC